MRVLKTGGRLVMQEHDIQGPRTSGKPARPSVASSGPSGKKSISGAVPSPLTDTKPLSKETDFVLKPIKAQWEGAAGETLKYTCIFEKGCTTFWGTKIYYPMADWWHGYPYMQKFVPKVKIPGR